MIVLPFSPTIRVKVIGLAQREGRLLAMEVETDSGRVTGVRPLGGSVDFGETREHALHREFLEELGTEITISGPWRVFENIFEHNGSIGHEIVFAAEVRLADMSLYGRNEIVFFEDDGTRCRAEWFDLEALAESDLELYPIGLGSLLSSAL